MVRPARGEAQEWFQDESDTLQSMNNKAALSKKRSSQTAVDAIASGSAGHRSHSVPATLSN